MTKRINRWIYAVVGVVISLMVGMVYAWSILSGPIAQEFSSWNKAQLSMTFTVVMLMFCVGCTVGGALSAKVEPRVFVWFSAALFLAGFMWCAKIQTLLELYLSFGAVCGFASGLVYNTVMSTVCKWFPDRRGLISGVLLMGFGFSSFFIGIAYQRFTPAVLGGWRQSFRFMGIVIAATLLLCSVLLKKPPADFAPLSTGKERQSFVEPAACEMTTAAMMRQKSFWFYFLWAIALSASGLALVSQASGIARETVSTLAADDIASIVGLISVFNGIGRVLFGALFDRFGRRTVMQDINLAYLSAMGILILALKANSLVLLVIGFVAAGMAYGGVNPAHSYFVSSYYGAKHFSLNFSVVVSNLLIASFGSTIAGAAYDRTGSYMSTYLLICALSALAILLSAGITWSDKCNTQGSQAGRIA